MRAKPGTILFVAVIACGGNRSDPSTTAADLSTNGAAAQHDVLGVMTRNLYLGADLTPVIAAQTQQQFLAATTAVWAMVQHNSFLVRAEGVADEIAAKQPALIGLQEAFTWRILAPQPRVVFDYVPALLAALAARGLDYRLVSEVELLQFAAPTLTGEVVQMTDHGAILARADVQTSNPAAVVYQHLLPLQVLGQPLFVKRGYVAADVQSGSTTLRFVSTHLESFHAGIRMLQAGELAAALAGESRPVILVGDLNSHPGTEGEAILAGAGFTDAWPAALPANSGLTCCWAEDLGVPQSPTNRFTERIDYVLTRGPLDARAVFVTGGNPSYRVGGLWPSDHGGLSAAVRVGEAR